MWQSNAVPIFGCLISGRRMHNAGVMDKCMTLAWFFMAT
jgi:hypothetical protein